MSVKKLSKLKKDLLVKGKDGSFEGNECSSEGEVAPAEREVKTLEDCQILLIAILVMMMMHSRNFAKSVTNSRYHVLLELYNESLEEPKEASEIRIIIHISYIGHLIFSHHSVIVIIMIIGMVIHCCYQEK